MEELGMAQIGPEFSVSCENHGGSGLGIVQQWNAADAEWIALTDFIAPQDALIDSLIAEDSTAFATENNITPGCL
jgi:branched-chain amino acid transport system substrate-binding protein